MWLHIGSTMLKIYNWTEKLDPATRKVTPRPFLILAAWEPPKPIHFWKGYQKSGRNGDEDEKFSKYGL